MPDAALAHVAAHGAPATVTTDGARFYWWAGGTTVALDVSTLTPAWTLRDTLGPPGRYGGGLLVPVPATASSTSTPSAAPRCARCPCRAPTPPPRCASRPRARCCWSSAAPRSWGLLPDALDEPLARSAPPRPARSRPPRPAPRACPGCGRRRPGATTATTAVAACTSRVAAPGPGRPVPQRHDVRHDQPDDERDQPGREHPGHAAQGPRAAAPGAGTAAPVVRS